MKKHLVLSLFIFIIFSCSKDNSDDQKNNIPSTPQLIYPSNNLLCIDTDLELQWSVSTDEDGDDITYLLEISKNINFSPVTYSFNLMTNSKTIAFDNGTRYFWRVKAIDSNNAESEYSNTFEFYTQGEAILNYLPFSPDVIFPTDNSTIDLTSVILEWTASDLNYDPLMYKIYLDTDNPPSQVIANELSTPNFTVELNSSTVYYWQVVVSDDRGGSTVGQVWTFETTD